MRFRKFSSKGHGKSLSWVGSNISKTGFPVTRFNHNDSPVHIAVSRSDLRDRMVRVGSCLSYINGGGGLRCRRCRGLGLRGWNFKLATRPNPDRRGFSARASFLVSWNPTDLPPAPTRCLKLSKFRFPWLPKVAFLRPPDVPGPGYEGPPRQSDTSPLYVCDPLTPHIFRRDRHPISRHTLRRGPWLPVDSPWREDHASPSNKGGHPRQSHPRYHRLSHIPQS